jgi:hypothetical protein
MSNQNLLMLCIGPVSVMVKTDRQSKGVSEAQLMRKWEARRAICQSREAARRTTVGVTVDWSPVVQVECRRSSS